MKIIQRIPSSELYAFYEIHYESLEEFGKLHAKATDIIRGKLPKPEPVPVCSICKKNMQKSSKGKFYCKHIVDGQIEWGKAVYPEKEPTEKTKEFFKDMETDDMI